VEAFQRLIALKFIGFEFGGKFPTRRIAFGPWQSSMVSRDRTSTFEFLSFTAGSTFELETASTAAL
jgi:hypothetical protein